MAALVGAVIGLVVATAVDAIGGVALGHNGYLAILLGGVAAGLVMRMLASGSGSIYAKGGLAALVTAVAAVAGPVVAAQWFQAKGASIASRGAPVAVVADADDAEVDVAVEEVPDIIEPTAMPIGANPSSYTMPTGRTDFAAPDMICMVLGCLVAYQLGKGAAPAPPAEEVVEGESAPTDGEPATEEEAHA